MSTPHNRAEKGDIAELVLMPGDPLRAEYIAEHFLEKPKCFNKVRGMLGFTGEYEGRRISVMGSGMGMPSMGIYSYELYNFYDVKYIIRIGSCGSYLKDSKLGDVFLVKESYTDSNFGYNVARIEKDTLQSSDMINSAIQASADKAGIKIRPIKALSTDVFYHAGKFDDALVKQVDNEMRKLGVAATDMESYALFLNALTARREASCLLTVSDMMGSREGMTPEDRERSFSSMMKVALGASEYLKNA